MLEILEQVAGQSKLGCRDGMPPRELERERCLAVVEHEAVVLGELLARFAGPERPGLAVRDDRQFEYVLAGFEPRPLALADHTARLVDECERAADVLADDCQECGRTASLDDGVCEPLMHLESALDPRKLCISQLRRDRLRQCDERHVVGDRDERKADLLGLVGERGGRLGPAEADTEGQACEPVLGEPAHILALRPGELADSQPRRDQELTALEPRRRIRQLGDMTS